MEIYILSKQDLSILSICKVSDYEINLDEETNSKSSFSVIKTEGLAKGNFLVVNGLYRQFLFLIDDVVTEKGSNISNITALDISNIFDRKIIEKNTDIMTTNSIEKFIADTMSENFVNSDDIYLNVGYIDIYWHTNTQGVVATNAENGIYNFHTFLINCRQYKNIYTEFQFIDGRLRIDIRNKEEATQLIDTTLPEVTDYNKVYDDDITAKVTVYIRENDSEYNLYLKTDRTTTENKNDPNRAEGKIEVISVDTADMAREEALNVMKGNTYNHLVEFKIAKTSKLMDVTKLYIGRTIRIRTDDDIYDSYISAITIRDENFIYFKSGNLRTTLIDKLKKQTDTAGNKIDVSGGVIKGKLDVIGGLKTNGKTSQSDGKAGAEVGAGNIELYHATPFIDFHFNNSTADYTSRIVEIASGTLRVPNNFGIGGDLTVDGIANKIFQHHGDAPSDLDNAITHGSYRLTNSYTNAPYTGTIYGILLVYESLGGTWQPSNQASWCWQIIMTTGGTIYMRTGVNSATMNAWVKLV